MEEERVDGRSQGKIKRFETYVRLGDRRLVLGKFDERGPAEDLADERRTILAGERWLGR